MDAGGRIRALEKLVAKYEKSQADFAAINEELRTLARRSEKLDEVLDLNTRTLESTSRLLQSARQRLERERLLATRSPFARSDGEAA